MKKGLLIIALLCFSLGFSQTNRESIQKAAKDFQTAFNASDYDAIFDMFDNKMKAEFPLERTKLFFKRIKESRGEIKSMEYYKLREEALVYKTTFEKDVMDVRLSLNEKNDKLSGLYIVAIAKK